MHIKNNNNIFTLPKVKKNINLVYEMILISEEIIPLNNVNVLIQTNTEPKYVSSESIIYLSSNFVFHSESIYKSLKTQFGDQYIEVIAFHEFGHAVEDRINKNPFIVNILNHPRLNYLFNGAAVPNKINNFMIESYKEGFADCYSALCMYKKYNDLSVFDKIYQARRERYIQIKKEHGKDFIHPNCNYFGAIEFKNIIASLKQKNINILDLPFEKNNNFNIEYYLEQAVLKSCLNTLVQELKINDSFLNQFRSYVVSEGFKLSTGNLLLNNYVQTYNLTQNDINNLNHNMVLPYFFEFLNRSNESIISFKKINNLVLNNQLNRQVDKNLVLKDVRNIWYNAGLESIENTISNIQKVRNNSSVKNQSVDFRSS